MSVTQLTSEGLGIDLGVKDFAVVSSGQDFGNINNSCKVRKIEKKLKRGQRSLSRKILKESEVTLLLKQE